MSAPTSGPCVLDVSPTWRARRARSRLSIALVAAELGSPAAWNLEMRSNPTDDVNRSATTASEPWRLSPYYDRAEARIGVWWDDGQLFRQLFDRLDLSHVVELACGHGRHTEQIKNRAGRITMMDILEDNVAFCRKRFAIANHVTALVNNGRLSSPLRQIA